MWALLMKLLLLLGDFVFELALGLAVPVLEVSDAHDEEHDVEDDVLHGVAADPVELGLLGLAVKLEHDYSLLEWMVSL